MEKMNVDTRLVHSHGWSKILFRTTAVLLVTTVIVTLLFVLCIAGVIPGSCSCSQSQASVSAGLSIEKDAFGTTEDGKAVDRYTMKNKNGMVVQVINLGGTITNITVPDKDGKMADVTLGFDNLNAYEQDDPGNPHFGNLVGRFANRIAKGEFTIDGETYHLNINNGPNSLHGGLKGWGKKVWTAEVVGDHLLLSYFSPDGEEHYPGDVDANVTIQLTNQNEIIIKYSARARTKATPINLTSHAYFNLAGEGATDIYDHEVAIFADSYTPVTEDLIPTGEIADVTGTLLDLRQPVRLGDTVNQIPGGGYDHNFCVRGPTGKKLASRVTHPGSGRVMEVYTDQPGLQLYTGYYVNVPNGKNGHSYSRHSGFAMEAQNYPDAINQPNFPDCVLRPGSEYRQQTSYKFSTI